MFGDNRLAEGKPRRNDLDQEDGPALDDVARFALGEFWTTPRSSSWTFDGDKYTGLVSP